MVTPHEVVTPRAGSLQENIECFIAHAVPSILHKIDALWHQPSSRFKPQDFTEIEIVGLQVDMKPGYVTTICAWDWLCPLCDDATAFKFPCRGAQMLLISLIATILAFQFNLVARCGEEHSGLLRHRCLLAPADGDFA